MLETSAAAGTDAAGAPADPTREAAGPVPPGYFRIENAFVDCYAERIGAIPVAVRAVMGRFADAKTGRCYPSIRTIARLLHLSQQTVLNAIAVLEKESLVRVERRRTKGGQRLVNVYTLLPVGGALAALAPVLNDVEHRAKGGLAEQDSINKTQENKGVGGSLPGGSLPGGNVRGANVAGCRPAHTGDPNLDHAAVKIYREICKMTPNEIQRVEMVAVVTDIPRWQEVLRAWIAHGYKKQNVPGMLDWYRKGIPERSDGNDWTAGGRRLGFGGDRAGERRKSGQPDTAEEFARHDAEWQALTRGLATGSATGRERSDS